MWLCVAKVAAWAAMCSVLDRHPSPTAMLQAQAAQKPQGQQAAADQQVSLWCAGLLRRRPGCRLPYCTLAKHPCPVSCMPLSSHCLPTSPQAQGGGADADAVSAMAHRLRLKCTGHPEWSMEQVGWVGLSGLGSCTRWGAVPRQI